MFDVRLAEFCLKRIENCTGCAILMESSTASSSIDLPAFSRFATLAARGSVAILSSVSSRRSGQVKRSRLRA